VILIRHGQSEFNVHFAATRTDPGIRDPHLTEEGRRQIAAGARLIGERYRSQIRRIVTSPYSRTLQSAAILADALDLPVTVDVRVGEHAHFSCDIGTARSGLEAAWPGLDFSHLAEEWWPEREEVHHVDARAQAFRTAMAADPGWPEVLVVSHWGFIRSLTGHRVPNAAVLTLDPTVPHPEGAVLVSPPDV